MLAMFDNIACYVAPTTVISLLLLTIPLCQDFFSLKKPRQCILFCKYITAVLCCTWLYFSFNQKQVVGLVPDSMNTQV